MAFEKNTAFEKRIEFKNNANASVFEFPKGNFFGSMDLDLNLDIDVATGAMVNIINHQVARMIEELVIMRDGEHVHWQVSGESLARLFRYQEGVESVDNAQISTGTGAGKTGRMFLHIPFYVVDSMKKSDCAMDTNSHKYELKIKFRDITADNVLYADTSAGTITVNDAGCYIDLTLHKITPVKGENGADSWQKSAPYFPGLTEREDTITATKSDFPIELPENKMCHSLLLFANADASAGVNPTGYNDIFTDRLQLKNTQGRVIMNPKATTIRQLTSLKRRNNSLENGLYDYDLTEYGNLVDSLLSDSVAPLKIVAAVAKKTNDTRVTTIIRTIERQGSGVASTK